MNPTNKIRPLPPLTLNDIGRFHAAVARGHVEECWPWLGTIDGDGDGYGKFSVNGKWHRATRIAVLIHTGTDPGELLVCHTCDNPRCCNPQHLFLGTSRDNLQDCARKGRCSMHRAKLSRNDVKSIRASAETTVYLARRYNVSHRTISEIQLGHICPDVSPHLIRESRRPVISEAIVRLIRRSTLSGSQLALQLGISPISVSRIRRGVRRASVK